MNYKTKKLFHAFMLTFFTLVYHLSLGDSANAMKSTIKLYDCTLPSHSFIAKAEYFISSNRRG